MGDIEAYILDLLYWMWDALVAAVNVLYALLNSLAAWIWNTFLSIAQAIMTSARWLWRALRALTHLKPSDIWHAIKRAYERAKGWYQWLKRNYFDPIDKMRRQIMDVYNRFFRPIIRFIDSLRVVVRIIGIFNRRLAAKLDSALFDLEAKIMLPITAVLHRLNEISSYMRAYFTALGYLDRVTLLESLRRDAGLAWEILTNPRALLYDTVKPNPRRTVADSVSDFKVWAKTGGGPTGDYVEHARQVFRDALGGVG